MTPDMTTAPIVYSTTNCPTCRMAKARMARAGVIYTEINVEHDAVAHKNITDAGYKQAPVFQWKGRYHAIDDLSKIIDEALDWQAQVAREQEEAA